MILEWLAHGWTLLVESYPMLVCDGILAALAFAAELIRDEKARAMHKASR